MPQTPLRFFFYWQALKPLDQDYRFALYLLDENRQVDRHDRSGRAAGCAELVPADALAARRDDQDGDQRHALVDGPVRQIRRGARRARGDDPWAREARLLPQIGGGDLAIPLADEKTLAELMNFRTDPGGMPDAESSRDLSAELPRGATAPGSGLGQRR